MIRQITTLITCLIFSIGFIALPDIYLTANQVLSIPQTRESLLISHVKKSIENAEKGISKIDSSVLSIEGMSSPIIRRVLNNLCSLNGARYLEIGCWKGSTFVAALYNNQATLVDAVAVENWSEFQGPRNEFHKNINTYLKNAPMRILETDCFSLNTSQVFNEPVNIYFYDGAHTEATHKAAFTYFDSILDDVFITAVDDWNWDGVRSGTYDAFQELGYEILFERSFFTPANQDKTSWWNGFYIAVIKKRN